MKMSGKDPTAPKTLPTIRSFLVILGSINNPTPISPPGTAYKRSLFSAKREITLVRIGVHFNYDDYDFEGIPGLISTSIPT